MAFQSLRDFLVALQKNGQLVALHDSVYPEPDIRKYLRAAADMGDGSPAIVFDQIKGEVICICNLSYNSPSVWATLRQSAIGNAVGSKSRLGFTADCQLLTAACFTRRQTCARH